MLRPLAYSNLGNGGRLGNQLWQIASTVGIARKKGMRPLFPAEWPYRPYFQCPDSWFGLTAPRMAQSTVYATHLDRRCRPYLQDLSLWGNVHDEITRAFQPSAAALAIVDEEWESHFSGLKMPTCAVHIRRGDYATNPVGSVTSLPISYYSDALKSLECGSVVVFSDDISWCRQEFPGAALYYEGIPRPVEQRADYLTAPVLDWIDLFLMQRCAVEGDIVISNSTYSWWAAVLAGSSSVRYPSRWFGSEMASFINFRLMIPEGWTEVEVNDG